MSDLRPSRGLTLVRALIVGVVAITLISVTLVVHGQTDNAILIAYWYLGASVLLASLVAFVVGRRHVDRPVAAGKVLAIVPTYNEDADGLDATVRALLAQTIDMDIVVIDDGSHVPVIPTVDHPRVTWLSQENTGKRGAQVAVLRRFEPSEYDFVVTVDSDSQPMPDAVEHLLRAMSDPKIQAATGMIYVRNFEDNWVSRAADIDIGGSCVQMRASRSMLGALETTSGALAIYRSDLLFDHLDAYAVECGTGDDRWLALRALRRGQVVGVAEAGVVTDMPTTLNGTYRQRLRWARSWWWMLPYVFKHLSFKQLLSPLYGLIQLFLTPLMLSYIALATIASLGDRYAGQWQILALYLVAYLVVRFAVSALYLIGRPGVSTGAKWKAWLLGTPAAMFMNLLLLVPTRYIALTKLLDNRWQTRELTAEAVSEAGRRDSFNRPPNFEEVYA